MEASTAGGSAPAAAAVLQQRHSSSAEALAYAGEERASTSARTNMEMLSCIRDARETTFFEIDVPVIPPEEKNFCRRYPASHAHPAAAGLTTAASVAAPAATVPAAATIAPALAVFAAGSPAAGAFSSPPGGAAHSPGAHAPAAALPRPTTSAAPPYTAPRSRVGGAAVTACEVKGAECLLAAPAPSQKASYEETSQHQQDRVHAACGRTFAGPTSQIETSSSKETSAPRWFCSSREHACVDRTPLIHCALPPGPSRSAAAAAIPPKTTACAAVSAGGTLAGIVSAAARAGGTPATAVSAAAAAISADASAPPAIAGAYAAVASAWSGCAPAAAFPSVAPATAGAGVGGGIRNLAAGAAAHFLSQPEQLCELPSMFFAFAAGAAGDHLRRADFALAGSEARGTEKRLAAHAAATVAAVDALDPSKVSGGAAGAAAAVGAVETNCPQCTAAASRHAADTAAAAAGSGGGLVALTTVAGASACGRRQQREYPSATATTAARACRRCSEVSTPPVADAVAARSSYQHSHRAGWRCLRSSAAAAAAAVCLVCATAAEAIICRIDASDGLLAAAVAAGSAMPTAEVFSFPLCRLPYLVNSDVPARDAPHVGLYAGGSIEIDLELLPAETYVNNMPLSEPRFYKHPRAAGPRRQEDTHQNEGAATAASSPKRKQQQTDSPFRVRAPTAQQQQRRAAAPAAVGSLTRELVAIIGPDVAGTAAAAVASSSTANAKAAAAREGGQREEAAAALWGTATGRDTAAATGGGYAVEGVTEERRKEEGTAQAEQQEAASAGQRVGRENVVEAMAGSRRTVSAARGRFTAARVVDGAQAPRDEFLHEERGERENAEGLVSSHFYGADQQRHSASATEGVETSQKTALHGWRDAAAGNSAVSVSAVEAAAFDTPPPFSDRIVAAESTAASGRSVAGASSSICPASEGNIPVTTSSGSTRVLESPSPLLSLYSSLFVDAAAGFASSSLRHMWSCVRSYLGLFAYSVAAAADLFFGIQASPLLLPASNRASTRAHIPFTDADRAALPKQQPTARSAFPFSLLFSSLYSATPFFVLPASNAPRQAAVHQQEEEGRQQQKQWQRETQNREKEQQQFSKSADRRETVTERHEATTDAAVEAEEEAKAEKDILIYPHSVVAGGTRALSFERDRDMGAAWPAEAPKRILQGIQSESPSRMHGLADEAERQDAAGQERLVVEEEGDDYEEEEEGGSTDQDDIAEGQRSESHAAGELEVLDATETKESYVWKNKAMQDRGETYGGAVARGELSIPRYDRFTASYGGGDLRDARSLQQQQKRQQQIAAAAAAWQRQLREDNQHPVDDPLVYTVNNTYVLVMSHFQYMVYQQDSGWLRSFTATDGIVANSYVPAFKRLTFTGPKLHARVEVPKLDRYAVVLLNADGLDLRLKGRITFLNPGNQQLSVEQISLPKLLLVLLLLHLLTVAVLAVVMLSFRRRRWTRVHFLILSNLLLCALCFALDRSQTIFFEEHGQRNPVLWLAARVCKKLQDIMALMAFILIALGWKTLRSQLTRIEVQFVAGLCVISLYLGVFEIILGGFQGTRYILHALGYVCVLVAINFNLALLHSHIMDAGITPTTSDLYHKYDAFRLYRGIFFLYLLKPVSLIFFKLSFLNPIYEQLLSWDEWIFVFANNAIDYSIFLALFYAFRPGGTMRILREVSQVTASDTRSDQATNVNAWPPG